MKDFINLFYSIVEKIETLDLSDNQKQVNLFKKYLNTDKNLDFYVDYFNKYRLFLKKNTLNSFTKDIINLNF
jgi:cytochrome b pre-mRNA-processing protein 3